MYIFIFIYLQEGCLVGIYKRKKKTVIILEHYQDILSIISNIKIRRIHLDRKKKKKKKRNKQFCQYYVSVVACIQQ